ncbi:unnamed protein product [Adineta ricciae]|uniref:Cyclin-like domain-containing protein n=1 Tax=Adineta ricciae TaxID=249248 RepID=A0A815J0T3_ADIRI|nr:unnamed protein product [Adineta ricciae]
METQQLKTMLSIEKSDFSQIPMKSYPKRRQISDYLHKLTDDERMSDDIFALAMNLFDRFIAKRTSFQTDDRSLKRIALCCYHISKKLRTNIVNNKENDQLSSIFLKENYDDEEIFDTEKMICSVLDWDLAAVVPHDYIQYFLPFENQIQIRSHVHILLSIAICELNTLTILPSLLTCACIKAAMNGLSLKNFHHIDDFIFQTIDCKKIELLQIQCMIEDFLQSCLQTLKQTPQRRCLAPIETSPQQRTRVK